MGAQELHTSRQDRGIYDEPLGTHVDKRIREVAGSTKYRICWDRKTTI